MNAMNRRILSFGLSMLVLALASSPPIPAQAATTLYVDNTAPLCKAGAHNTIQAAVNAAPASNVTITVCPGIYLAPITISGRTNFKLVGKSGAKIVSVFNPHNGPLVKVQDSTNVTIQGFTIDGKNQLGGDYGTAAILMQNSSGTIQKNVINSWGSPANSLVNYGIMSIWVTTDVSRAVKITGNTIWNFQSQGIQVNGPAVLTITSNKIDGSGASNTPPIGLRIGGTASGKPTGSISKNTLLSTTFPTIYISTAIDLYDVGPIKVNSNTISHWYTGIRLQTEGANGYTMDSNTIASNKLNEVDTGIQFIVAANANNAQANNTKITGNKITKTGSKGSVGISLQAYQNGWWFATAQTETITGNTITNFLTGVYISPAAANVLVSGKFSPNKVK